MFAEINDLRKAQAVFNDAKAIFDRASQAQVIDYLHDGQKKTAFKAAMDLLKFAKEHHATVELSLKELADPTKTQEEIAQILAHAKDHQSELGKFLDEAKAVAGAELDIIMEAIAAHEAAQAGK